MRIGSYEVVLVEGGFVIGENKDSQIQPFVTWRGPTINKAHDAIFHETYEQAYDDYQNRKNQKDEIQDLTQ